MFSTLYNLPRKYKEYMWKEWYRCDFQVCSYNVTCLFSLKFSEFTLYTECFSYIFGYPRWHGKLNILIIFAKKKKSSSKHVESLYIFRFVFFRVSSIKYGSSFKMQKCFMFFFESITLNGCNLGFKYCLQ